MRSTQQQCTKSINAVTQKGRHISDLSAFHRARVFGLYKIDTLYIYKRRFSKIVFFFFFFFLNLNPLFFSTKYLVLLGLKVLYFRNLGPQRPREFEKKFVLCILRAKTIVAAQRRSWHWKSIGFCIFQASTSLLLCVVLLLLLLLPLSFKRCSIFNSPLPTPRKKEECLRWLFHAPRSTHTHTHPAYHTHSSNQSIFVSCYFINIIITIINNNNKHGRTSSA